MRAWEQAFAVQAGREVRIMVKPDVISDDQVILLARQIAKKIEDTLDYPGQIKVNVIRESRAVEYDESKNRTRPLPFAGSGLVFCPEA